MLFLANLCFVLLSCVSVCGSKFLMQELLFSILVKVPRVDRLEYPDFKPAGDGGGLGELAVHGDRVRLVHQHLLVRVQVVKVETLWRRALLRTSGIFSYLSTFISCLRRSCLISRLYHLHSIKEKKRKTENF